MKQLNVSGLKTLLARMGTVVDGTFDDKFNRGVEATLISAASMIMPAAFLSSGYYTGFDGLFVGLMFSGIPLMVGGMMLEDGQKKFATFQITLGGGMLGLLAFKALSLGLIGSVDFYSVPCAVVTVGVTGLFGAATVALAESIENK